MPRSARSQVVPPNPEKSLRKFPRLLNFTPRGRPYPYDWAAPTEAQPRREGNRLTAGRGHCPEMFVLIQDGTRLCPPMWGSSPESTPSANRQPVYRERIRECSIAQAHESLMQPVRPHEAVESRSRAEGQQQYQKQCRDCHAPPVLSLEHPVLVENRINGRRLGTARPFPLWRLHSGPQSSSVDQYSETPPARYRL